MKQLKRLTVLTHPAYATFDQPIDPQETIMLRSIETMVKGIAKKKREALLILMQHNKDVVATIKEDADHPMNSVLTMLGRIQRKLKKACVRIDGALLLNIPFCIGYLEHTRAALIKNGFRINAKTEIVGIGETASACVPHVIQNFGTLLESATPPKVLLDYTTAAQPASGRENWTGEGWKLRRAKKEWPHVEFVPLGTHKGVLKMYEDAE